MSCKVPQDGFDELLVGWDCERDLVARTGANQVRLTEQCSRWMSQWGEVDLIDEHSRGIGICRVG